VAGVWAAAKSGRQAARREALRPARRDRCFIAKVYQDRRSSHIGAPRNGGDPPVTVTDKRWR
jgi:hypothetical protein